MSEMVILIDLARASGNGYIRRVNHIEEYGFRPVLVIDAEFSADAAAECRNCRSWESRTDSLGNCMRPYELGALFGPDDMGGGLQTEPEFGCIQFQRKDEAKL